MPGALHTAAAGWCTGSSSGGMGIAGSSDAGPAMRPICMNSTASDAPIATAATLRADRQLQSTLSEIRCRHATNRTLPPAVSISASSAAFSCAVQTRRRSTRPRISTSDKSTSFWSYRRSLQRPAASPGRARAATRRRPDAYDENSGRFNQTLPLQHDRRGCGLRMVDVLTA